RVYIVVYDWSKDTAISLASSGNNDVIPVWTPNGQRIVFTRTRAGESNLYWQNADGTGEAQRLTEGKMSKYATSWSPNGSSLAFSEEHQATGTDVMILPVNSDDAGRLTAGSPTPYLNGPANEDEAMFSPDGRWIAYVSEESGRNEVYVRPFIGSE